MKTLFLCLAVSPLLCILMLPLSLSARTPQASAPSWLVKVQSDYKWKDSKGQRQSTTIAGWGVVLRRNFEQGPEKFFVYTSSHLTGGENLQMRTLSGKILTWSRQESLTDAAKDNALFQISEMIETPLNLDMHPVDTATGFIGGRDDGEPTPEQNRTYHCDGYSSVVAIRVDQELFSSQIAGLKQICTPDRKNCILMYLQEHESAPELLHMNQSEGDGALGSLAFVAKPGFSGRPLFRILAKDTRCESSRTSTFTWAGLIIGYHPFYQFNIDNHDNIDLFYEFLGNGIRGFRNPSRWKFDGDLVKKIDHQAFERIHNAAGNSTRGDGGNSTRGEGGNATRGEGGNQHALNSPIGMSIHGDHISAFRVGSHYYVADENNYRQRQQWNIPVGFVKQSDLRHEDLLPAARAISSQKACQYSMDKNSKILSLKISGHKEVQIDLGSLNRPINLYTDYLVPLKSPKKTLDIYNLLFIKNLEYSYRFVEPIRFVRIQDQKAKTITNITCEAVDRRQNQDN